MTIRATESQCQRTIVDAARLGGWMIYHNRPALTRSGRVITALQGHGGFPDLVLVHARARLVWFVELKRKPNKLGPDQKVWGDALTAAGADWRVVYVPEELDSFCQTLASMQPRPVMTLIIHDPGPGPHLFDWDGET